MRNVVPLSRLAAALCLAAVAQLSVPARADDPLLDLTMTIDLYCGDPAVSGTLGGGWNVAYVGDMCGNVVMTGGTTNAYGVNLTAPTLLTITTVSPALQVTVLAGPPWTAGSCVAYTALTANPTLSLCLPAGYYPIQLSSPLNIITPFEISVACEPCEPVGNEGMSWGALKGSYR